MKCVHGREVGGGFFGEDCSECNKVERRHKEVVNAIENLGRPAESADASAGSGWAVAGEVLFGNLGMTIGAVVGGASCGIACFRLGGLAWGLGGAIVGVVCGALAGLLAGAMLGGCLPLIILGALLYLVFSALGIK